MSTVTTTYTTSGDVPPAAWAALLADMRRLLQILAADGTAVTGPDGAAEAELDDDTIAFTATAPSLPPLTVRFQRAAGSGETSTSHPATTGLTLAAMTRAARHWGQLLAWSSDADITARALGDTLVEALFGEDDRAVAGVAPMSVPSQVGQMTAAALAASTDAPTLLAGLDDVIGVLQQRRAGIAAALALLAPAAPAAPSKRSHTRKARP